MARHTAQQSESLTVVKLARKSLITEQIHKCILHTYISLRSTSAFSVLFMSEMNTYSEPPFTGHPDYCMRCDDTNLNLCVLLFLTRYQ